MLRRALKIVALILLWSAPVAAQLVAVDSHVDKSTIRIGDLVKYTVTVTHSDDVALQMPGLAANLGSFEIRDYAVHDPQKKDGQVVQSIEYMISTFDVGEFEIPPLVFRYSVSGDTMEHELKTEKLKIVVESLKPSEAGDIRDIKGPESLPRNYRQLILWGSIAMAVALLLGGLYYVYRRRKAGKGLLPKREEPQRPPHEVALQALNDLKASSLLAEGRVKEYYIQVSEIIRRYIEGRYFIIALELTTHELIENLRAADVEPGIVQRINEFLDSCDLVKFAKYQPTENENGEIVERAIEIVERTKLVYDQPSDETPSAVEAEAGAPSNNESVTAISEEVEVKS
jgi:hypothetical protein